MLLNVTHNKHKDRKLYTKSYDCHADVRRVMQEMLWYKKDMNELEMTADTKHKRYLDKEKVLLLRKRIFPAMANLVVSRLTPNNSLISSSKTSLSSGYLDT